MNPILPLTAAGIAYMVAVWLVAPRRIKNAQFFSGRSEAGVEPGFWLLAASAAISWIFAKSIVNSASLTHAFGLAGGGGYAVYYLSFAVVAGAVYLLRTRGGYSSLPDFLVRRYGAAGMKLFLLAIGIRLLNEVWSNTKVVGLFFGAEGGAAYWGAVLAFTVFTVLYSLKSGLRGSLLTDGIQMLFAAVLLIIILAAIYPDVTSASPAARVSEADTAAGLTFAMLALVQTLSYGFHDPVLTDRAFITSPKKMLGALLTAGAIGGAVIFLFGLSGVYARVNDFESGAIASWFVSALPLPLLLVFNVMMLTSAGSTLDSTFASTAKLSARDWPRRHGEPDARQLRLGRWAIAAIAIVGNLPLLTLYFGDQIGPAIIKATTISGTMVMGLAPVFLLAFIRRAGAASFHLSFWCGLALGVLLAAAPGVFPEALIVGEGKYALSLGVNAFGVCACAALFVAGAFLFPAPRRPTGEGR